MSIRILPAVVAGILASGAAALLFVPFVAREYRKHGEFRTGAVVLRFGALLYALGLIAYVLLPLPPVAPGFCAAWAHLEPQWRPLAELRGLRRPGDLGELTELLALEPVQQFGYNIALFLPFGLLVRLLSGRGTIATVALGWCTSLGVELTQLTAIWGLYPCPYRLFDVDDLIANTTGAALGAVLAPVGRWIAGTGTTPANALLPRPMTARRRLLGMLCDLLLLWWLGLAAMRAVEIIIGSEPEMWRESIALWFGPSVMLLLATLLSGGTSLGQRAVQLRVVTSSGRPSTAPRTLLRWAVGLGGFAVIQGLVHASPRPELGAPLAAVWCAAHALGALRSGPHHGITGVIAGLRVQDARAPRGGSTGERAARGGTRRDES